MCAVVVFVVAVVVVVVGGGGGGGGGGGFLTINSHNHVCGHSRTGSSPANPYFLPNKPFYI